MPETLQASRTAVQVCQGRAAADGLIAPGRFADPTAMALLLPGEREVVRRVREQEVPKGWRDRIDYETIRATTGLMAPRTVFIDDAVRERLNPQVVILGAGLDGRAWRMAELAGAAVFEVDQPASQADKRRRAAELSGPPPTFVPVDFGRDRLGDALDAAGHRTEPATTWIWEGVVPYLTEAEVASTVAAVAARSGSGSRLVVNFQVPAAKAKLGRLVVRLLMASTGRRSIWAREPWRSTWTPDAMTALLGEHGFTVTRHEPLTDTAAALGVPIHHRASLGQSHVMVADRG
ncbi:class I SAM-dependent methyltransferase [Paractinoplanes atraurantiacus]|uniref:S-adenosyl-L-methionine-dependent methyltransferase n=1 Tax=Paractinoplanes atraurantiacus TaxID=1036182 RepID=A0A285JYS0_9ACTN|nr:class I SAM-dependent methyltransferase [Actinoplanes atraurantiacus]SNY64907.1 methyltransferase, TIGR00027 family [Actinoplanes atraurantiacus]